MSEILQYTLKDASKFRGCHTHLRDLWPFFGVFEVKKLSKLNITLKIIASMTKITILRKTLTLILNKRSNFRWCNIYFRDLWWSFCGFWDAKIVKPEYNPKNIRKCSRNCILKNRIVTKIVCGKRRLLPVAGWVHFLYY